MSSTTDVMNILSSTENSSTKIELIKILAVGSDGTWCTVVNSSASDEKKIEMLEKLMDDPAPEPSPEPAPEPSPAPAPAPVASAESIAIAATAKKKKKNGTGYTKGGPPIAKDPKVASRMVKNNAGGYSFPVELMTMFLRFLILGCSTTYYSSGLKLTLDSVNCLNDLIKQGHGEAALEQLLNVSLDGRAANQDATMLALAVLTVVADINLRKKAFAAITKICRIPTHLISFVNYREMVGGGWGTGFCKAGSKYFTEMDPSKLAYHMTKYNIRDGWRFLDLLRQFHPNPPTAAHNLCFAYAAHGEAALGGIIPSKATPVRKQPKMPLDENFKKVKAFLSAVVEAKTCDVETLCSLIRKYNLVREHMPTPMLNHVEVWKALLEKMPLTAMIRNLGTMSAKGVFNDPAMIRLVIDAITNQEKLHKARVHPMTVFFAYMTYNNGSGMRSSNAWPVIKEIADTLIDKTFKLCYKNVEPSGKRILVALDISGSMTGYKVCGNESVNCMAASLAEALVIAATEDNPIFLTFSTSATVVEFTADTTYSEAWGIIQKLSMGGTDCALPWLWAIRENLDIDGVVVYTDNETWASGSLSFNGPLYRGNRSSSGPAVCDAMNKYRKIMKKPEAAMVVVAMALNEFTIADPKDPLMMDRVGCDPNGLVIQNELLAGKLTAKAVIAS